MEQKFCETGEEHWQTEHCMAQIYLADRICHSKTTRPRRLVLAEKNRIIDGQAWTFDTKK